MVYVLLLLLVVAIVWGLWESNFGTTAVRRRERDAQLVCPHCQVTGKVRSLAVVNKKGVSGGKATGAVLTGGASLLATGLSRKERATRMTCGNCGTVWHV